MGKRVMVMEVPGKRTRGRRKRMWLDNIKKDLSERESCQGRKHARQNLMETYNKKHRSRIKISKAS